MAPLVHLLSCSVIEKDKNGDVLWAWTYPSISESRKAFVNRKFNSLSDQNNSQSFACVRHDKTWFYIFCQDVSEHDELPKVEQFALVLSTKDFNPLKYEALSKVLSRTYSKTGSPVKLLELYLSTFTKGNCYSSLYGPFVAEEYNKQYANSNVKSLIKTFELETILIYTALLLKKRIVVYHHSLEQLLEWIIAFPVLMKHRKLTDHLFPWVDLVKDELTEIKNHSHYIVGCKDSSVLSRTDLYDLFVNLPAREITVPTHAKESLTMTKTHKEIALFMVQLSENYSLNDAQVVSEIAIKTQDLLNQMTTLATVETSDGRKLVSAQTIKDKNLAPAVENFLINLAKAENLFVF